MTTKEPQMKTLSDWKGRLIVGRYELREHINTSEMSCVFKAWDCQGKWEVIVKIAINSSRFDDRVTRLKRETEALRTLKHPAIVRLLDSGQIDRLSYFLVLEYIQGNDLQMALELFRYFSIDESISVLVQVLEALHEAHKKNMIHRDVKSANIMIAPDGVKLVDFGLVKFDPDYNPLRKPTATGNMVGTRLYASPEQAMGTGRYDCRSDLYSCGVVLYEILTRSLPFYEMDEDSEEWEDYWNHLRPFSKIYSIPKKVQAIVWKALSVDPDLRYQTAEEMRVALLAARPFSLRRFVKGLLSKARRYWRWFWE